jgi:amylosucrase
MDPRLADLAQHDFHLPPRVDRLSRAGGPGPTGTLGYIRSVADWIPEDIPRAMRLLRAPALAPFRKPGQADEFWDRLSVEFESIFRNFHRLYGWRWDYALQLQRFVGSMAETAAARRKRHRRRVDATPNAWLNDPVTIWAQAYVDRFVGRFDGLAGAIPHLRRIGVTHLHLMPPYLSPEPNDGGYAVTDYRKTDPRLGTMADLVGAIDELAEGGIGVCLDVVLNHTASDHPWARAAADGDPRYRGFYHLYQDRSVPDRIAPHLRSVFPDRPGDAFTWHPEVGSWVWTTFHEYQWDLDYRNPEVLTAMASEIGFLANLGVDALRLDATPFVWKEVGTSCENLPESHVIVELLSAYVRVVSPGLQLLSEAIVHPDDVKRFVRPEEARMGYNPLLMALMWEALATKDVRFLVDGLETRTDLPPGCQWLTYLRCHDDIGWGFADEDAARLGIDPDGHRRFLNEFYSGEFPGSFAAGMRFQQNPETGDARISGTLAALAGLQTAQEGATVAAVDVAVQRIVALYTVMFTSVGIPLLFLGDEIGQLNDPSYLGNPDQTSDNRWAHRPRFDWPGLERAVEGSGAGSAILAAVTRLAAKRGASPAFRSAVPSVIDSGHPSVLAYVRESGGARVTVTVNFSEEPANTTLEWAGVEWNEIEDPPGPVTLEPYGVRVWEVRPQSEPGELG